MLNVVILAAGQGKRMQSDLPKVLHPVAGRPVLAHVISAARELQPKRIVIVVGHGAERVQQAFTNQTDLTFVTQSPQNGTGHAVQQALPQLDTGGQSTTLVLYGDVPLVQPNTLKQLLAACDGGLAILTETMDNPAGYGRILRDSDSKVTGIVEDKDATASQRAITEVNTGILAASTARLADWLSRIDNNNAQGEYYLTDSVALAVQDQVVIGVAQPRASWETRGVNSRVQ